ncbi:L-lactate dehydrogenase (cytochrome) [Hanseniaspora uvarum]|nr:L-lactate dehydrogenase (cytochrome) [Hanseniaspora uvarum]
MFALKNNKHLIRNVSTFKRSTRYLSTNFKQTANSRVKRNYLLLSTALLVSGYGVYNSNNNKIVHNEPSKKNLPTISLEEFVKHSKPEDCWVIINGIVYDLTNFISQHPGGPEIIKANCGHDVSKLFNPLHAKDMIDKYIDKKDIKGVIDPNCDFPDKLVTKYDFPGETRESISLKNKLKNNLPDIDDIKTIFDFEYICSKILPKKTWFYYSSGAEDEFSLRENHNVYHRVQFRPKILVDVSEVSTECEMLGKKRDVPFFVCATALAALGNESGEIGIAEGCAKGEFTVPQMISTLSSKSLGEITAARKNNQDQWFQLYVNTDRSRALDLIKEAEKTGCSAIFVTVDAPSLGNREKDVKLPGKSSKEDGVSKGLSTFIDPSLNWDDVKYLKTKTNLPMFIKGIQRKEDALTAAKDGFNILLSNHGGRQLDHTVPPLQTLSEVVPLLKENGFKPGKDLEVFIDGGVRRGNDVLKAIALGATGVGLGRPILYSNSAYGAEGVNKCKEIMRAEIAMNMRLLGVTKLDQLDESFVDIEGMKMKNVRLNQDFLGEKVYEPREVIKWDKYDELTSEN